MTSTYARAHGTEAPPAAELKVAAAAVRADLEHFAAIQPENTPHAFSGSPRMTSSHERFTELLRACRAGRKANLSMARRALWDAADKAMGEWVAWRASLSTWRRSRPHGDDKRSLRCWRLCCPRFPLWQLLIGFVADVERLTEE